jgi:hypothetical protein
MTIEATLDRIARALEKLVEKEAVVPVEEKRPGRGRPPKVAVSTPSPELIAQPELMNENESASQVMEVAGAFVRRFQNAQPSGQDQAREMLKVHFGGRKIKELSHEQRVDFIDMMKEKLDGATGALTSAEL